VARELRDRDAFLGGLIARLRSEHKHDIEGAGSHSAAITLADARLDASWWRSTT
jgi:hypothetical protein